MADNLGLVQILANNEARMFHYLQAHSWQTHSSRTLTNLGIGMQDLSLINLECIPRKRWRFTYHLHSLWRKLQVLIQLIRTPIRLCRDVFQLLFALCR